MKQKLTRRDLLGTLGATAGVTATSCGLIPSSPPAAKGKDAKQVAASLQTATPIPGRVNLVCHGQLLFLWTKQNKDFITILLPEPPKDATGKELHKIYLGGRNGKNPDNVLPPPQSGGPPYKFDLTISSRPATPFTRKRSLFRGGPRQGEDVVLKHEDQNVKLADNRRARYTLTVPYPSEIRRFTIMEFFGNDVFGGDAARILEVYPRQMAGVHVFTYDGAIGQVKCSSSPNSLGVATAGLNIHLYSQPDQLPDLAGDHLHHFNRLVNYKHDNGNRRDLDLMDLGTSYPTPPIGSASDLSEEDLLSLYDLSAFYALEAKDRGTFRPQGAQPVECLQGWGS